MRYTVTRQVIQVIGTLWMGGTAAMDYTLTPYDMENVGDPEDRKQVERWVMLHSGDFQGITDFRADFDIGDKHIVHEWASEESECTYSDCMYPGED